MTQWLHAAQNWGYAEGQAGGFLQQHFEPHALPEEIRQIRWPGIVDVSSGDDEVTDAKETVT
eukprot:12924937-Prorocentrum_lima.AAC.1